VTHGLRAGPKRGAQPSRPSHMLTVGCKKNQPDCDLAFRQRIRIRKRDDRQMQMTSHPMPNSVCSAILCCGPMLAFACATERTAGTSQLLPELVAHGTMLDGPFADVAAVCADDSRDSEIDTQARSCHEATLDAPSAGAFGPPWLDAKWLTIEADAESPSCVYAVRTPNGWYAMPDQQCRTDFGSWRVSTRLGPSSVRGAELWSEYETRTEHFASAPSPTGGRRDRSRSVALAFVRRCILRGDRPICADLPVGCSASGYSIEIQWQHEPGIAIRASGDERYAQCVRALDVAMSIERDVDVPGLPTAILLEPAEP
jgi:hypothetical protein